MVVVVECNNNTIPRYQFLYTNRQTDRRMASSYIEVLEREHSSQLVICTALLGTMSSFFFFFNVCIFGRSIGQAASQSAVHST